MTEEIHSCSPNCDRPECVRAERDRLREALRLAHEAIDQFIDFYGPNTKTNEARKAAEGLL